MGWGWEEGVRVLAPLRQKGGALGFPQAGDWGVGTSSGGRLRHGGSLRREGRRSWFFRPEGASIRVPSGRLRPEGMALESQVPGSRAVQPRGRPGRSGSPGGAWATASRGQQSQWVPERPRPPARCGR